MSFGLRAISIASIAGVLVWAASAAPIVSTGSAQSQAFGYGYGAGKVTICHIPPGNPGNAHTITVGAPAVSAHLAHGDTLGACAALKATTNSAGKSGKAAGKSGKAAGKWGKAAGRSARQMGQGCRQVGQDRRQVGQGLRQLGQRAREVGQGLRQLGQRAREVGQRARALDWQRVRKYSKPRQLR